MVYLSSRPRVRPVIVCMFALAASFGLGACTLGLRSHDDTRQLSFEQALHECRMRQPGRLNKRRNLPPTSGGVSRCLKRHGWSSSGERIESEELAIAE